MTLSMYTRKLEMKNNKGKYLKLSKTNQWKNDINYWDQLSPEESVWLADVIDTEYSRTKHPDYSDEDMKTVYSNNNASDRCIMSNRDRSDRPSVVYDGDTISRGNNFTDIKLDINNIPQEEVDILRTKWKVSFDTAYESLMDYYSNRDLKNEDLLLFYIKLNQLLRWERIERKKDLDV